MAAPPSVPPPVNPSPESSPGARWAPHRVAAASVTEPTAPPESNADRAVYGFMQPLLGARMLFRDAELLRAALGPALLLAAFCSVVALLDDAHSWLHNFYATFAFLAPLPSLILARHYARLAALARHKFGNTQALPCYEPLRRSFVRLIKQTILVAVALIPLTLVLRMVPFVGPLAIRVVAALWALHWVVVDAFDSARTLAPGQTLADLDRLAAELPSPWFVRLLRRAADRLPIGAALLRRFARHCDGLGQPFREEIALIEQQPWLMAGFALSTAALLATPVLNLLFRPIVLIGAAHVTGHFEHAPEASTAPATSTALSPTTPTQP